MYRQGLNHPQGLCGQTLDGWDALVEKRLEKDTVQRLGPATTIRPSGAIALIGLGIVIWTKTLTLALPGFALTGSGYAIVMPLVFSRAANDPSMRPGPAITSVATLGYGGMLLGPPIVGFIAQITVLRVSFDAIALLAILTICLATTCIKNDNLTARISSARKMAYCG